MSSKLPFQRWYWADFLEDTIEWTPAEVGCYVRLLGRNWIAGTLPSSRVKLARLAGLDEDEFATLWPTMQHKFVASEVAGRITHPRTAHDREQTKRRSKKCSQAAKAEQNE